MDITALRSLCLQALNRTSFRPISCATVANADSWWEDSARTTLRKLPCVDPLANYVFAT